MGFLSGITKTLFGGSDDKAISEQSQANERSQAFIREQAALARGDANYLYPAGDAARNQGISAAMGLMGRALPEQMRMFQGGNQAAQLHYMQGQPQYKNDILGMQPQSNPQFDAGVMRLPPERLQAFINSPEFHARISEQLGGRQMYSAPLPEASMYQQQLPSFGQMQAPQPGLSWGSPQQAQQAQQAQLQQSAPQFDQKQYLSQMLRGIM